MNEENLYENLTEKILARVDGKLMKEKCKSIGKLLSMSPDTVYNKIMGRSKFTLEETFIITSKLSISLDSIAGEAYRDKTFIPFHSDGLKYSPREYTDYFKNISMYFSKISQLKNAQGYFIANEIHLFHLLDFPFLLYLKLYLWNKVNWNISTISSNYEPSSILNHSIKTEINLLKNYYNSFRSTEIWNPYMINNLISQFNYLRSAEIIVDPNHIVQFKYEMMALINYLDSATESSLKPPNHKGLQFATEILFTELHIGSELILVTTDNQNFAFHQLDTPNYIRTSDDRLIEKLITYYFNVKKLTISITESGDAIKRKMFNGIRNLIEDIK